MIFGKLVRENLYSKEKSILTNRQNSGKIYRISKYQRRPKVIIKKRRIPMLDPEK